MSHVSRPVNNNVCRALDANHHMKAAVSFCCGLPCHVAPFSTVSLVITVISYGSYEFNRTPDFSLYSYSTFILYTTRPRIQTSHNISNHIHIIIIIILIILPTFLLSLSLFAPPSLLLFAATGTTHVYVRMENIMTMIFIPLSVPTRGCLHGVQTCI